MLYFPACTTSHLNSLARTISISEMRILIIRHADPEYTIDNLTDQGKKQAHALANRLASGLDGKLTHIYSSPLGRAQATAAPTSAATGIPVTIEPWTRELNFWPPLPGGEELASWDLGGAAIEKRDTLSIANQWGERENTFLPGVKEKYADLQAASDAFVARHGYQRISEGTYRAVKENRDIIAVFCHGGFGAAWLAHLLHIPLASAFAGFYLAPSSLSTVLFDERGVDAVSPRAVGIGDTGHLYAQGLTTVNSKYETPNKFGSWVRPSGIKANFF